VIEPTTDPNAEPSSAATEPAPATAPVLIGLETVAPVELIGAERAAADAPRPDASVEADFPGQDAAAAAETSQADVTPAEAAPAVAETAGLEPHVDPGATAKRHTKLMADLSRAMQAAAEQTRNETMTRFEAEAKTVADEIHAVASTESADLRHRADDDVAAVREWSKAEIARIRELTESRIAERKTALDGELEAHAEVVETRVQRVSMTVAAFRAEMDDFFARLMAEEDPTRIATMAEVMPEPPGLAEIAASIPAPEPPPFAPIPVGAHGATAPAVVTPDAGFDFAAAEAEAALLGDDLDLEAPADVPSVATVTGEPEAAASAPAASAAAPPIAAAPAERLTTRVVVLGLVSVASIAHFKRELARTPGIATIGVASGPDGEFVFTVTHDPGLALVGAITALDGFEARIDSQTADTIEVTAHDPDIVD